MIALLAASYSDNLSAKGELCIKLRHRTAPEPCRGPADTQTQTQPIAISAGFVTKGQLDPYDVTW